MTKLNIQRFAGPDIQAYIPALATLRIQVFRDYPYLYEDENNPQYEEKYLATYTHCPESVLILVFDGEKIVGASTAVPLKDEMEAIKAPFLSSYHDLNAIFYCGESVLLPAYRGQGIGQIFFKEREQAAQEKGYSTMAFCAVERPDQHPKRPKNWYPLDTFWQKLGYRKHPELKAFLSWKEIGDNQESTKPMIFWLKHMR